MKHFIGISLIAIAVTSCASNSPDTSNPAVDTGKAANAVATIETSGDLYFSADSPPIGQIDFFGSCAPGHEAVEVVIEKQKNTTINCVDNRYRYTLALPAEIFSKNSSAFVLQKINIFHPSQPELGASSYLLIDPRGKIVKSVLNRQIRFEKIPTGQYLPVTEFSTFGSCKEGSQVNIDLTAIDRFGRRVSKYDDKKVCKSSVFYFLSQMDGVVKKGMRFQVYETPSERRPNIPRSPATAGRPQQQDLFQWTVQLQ